MHRDWWFNYLHNQTAWIVDLTIEKVRFSDWAQKVLLHDVRARGKAVLVGFSKCSPDEMVYRNPMELCY